MRALNHAAEHQPTCPPCIQSEAFDKVVCAPPKVNCDSYIA